MHTFDTNSNCFTVTRELGVGVFGYTGLGRGGWVGGGVGGGEEEPGGQEGGDKKVFV